MHRNEMIKSWYCASICLLCWHMQAHSQSISPLQYVASTRFTAVPNVNSQALDRQYEISAFLDLIYLEKFGGGLGYIYQNQRYSNSDKIANDLYHYDVWYSVYPQSLPGKLTAVFNGYRQESNSYTSEEITVTNPGSGMGAGSSARAGRVSSSITRNSESLNIINPEFSFINYAKTFYVDVGYANSDYQSSDASIGDLTVRQWTFTGGFAVNDRYDWLQARAYFIDLSNDLRTPGTDNTKAAVFTWTHWLRNKPANLESTTLKALVGERLYAVDSEIRKVYNLSDLQKGSIAFGLNWALSDSTKLYTYCGYEAYEDLADEEDYKSAFIDFSLSKHW